MRVMFFGRLAEAAGTRESDVALPVDVTTVAGLKYWLCETSLILAAALSTPDVRAVIDDQIVGGDRTLGDACEVAFIPAVSGG